MKRQSLLVGISTVLMITAYTTVNGQSNGSDSWSAYQGQMNWSMADAKCRSIGMRLPTINELKDAYNSRVTKSWQNNDSTYWSSTPAGDGVYYLLSVYDGYSHPLYRNVYADVICRH